MSTTIDISPFEVGFFTIAEVARLTQIPVRRARRWMRGYTYPTAKGKVRQEPLWKPELPHGEGEVRVLSFNELIEVRAIDLFCERGVPLQKVRKAIRDFEAEGIAYPFSNKRIITDGNDLYRKLKEENDDVLDEKGRPILVIADGKQQIVSYDAILNSIVKDLGFGSEIVDSYFPDRKKYPHVVIDPRRAFGHPTILGTRIEVEVIVFAHKSNPSAEYVADWFDIDKESVEEAVSFHEQFLAA